MRRVIDENDSKLKLEIKERQAEELKQLQDAESR